MMRFIYRDIHIDTHTDTHMYICMFIIYSINILNWHSYKITNSTFWKVENQKYKVTMMDSVDSISKHVLK